MHRSPRMLLLTACCVVWTSACDGNGNGNGDENGHSPQAGIEIDVSSVFPAGTALRDAYGGGSMTVDTQGMVRVDVAADAVVLLERDEAPGPEARFSWDNATVYFVITDRFENGDASNDTAYGRQPDGGDEIGTFHGGDLRGLMQRLGHLEDLGVNAVWISPPYEQVHGWVGGGSGDFKHYAYHGYYALDYTRLDAAQGTTDDLRAFVGAAHARGIRVVLDVVMNHPGYGTMQDLQRFIPDVLSPGWETWEPGPGETYHSYNQLFIDYTSEEWANWWGGAWVRAALPGGYSSPGSDDLTGSLASLPDFRTEDWREVELAPLLTNKDDTLALEVPGYTVRDYLVAWLTDWVADYGIDGFRCDTAKHVELASWAALKQAAEQALVEWKASHPADKLDDLPFWTTGEVFPHGVVRDAYFDNGFDSLINFEFQNRAQAIIGDSDELDALYEDYAAAINTDPTFNVLSYISSHDTALFFDMVDEDLDKQAEAGTVLLLAPGGVQIFYGDETGRPFGPTGTDPDQGTRSDMNWNAYDPDLLAHWQRLGQFRKRHIAVGAGSHTRLSTSEGYAFARQYNQDGVEDAVVVLILD